MESGRQEDWWGKSQRVVWFSGNCNQAPGEPLSQCYPWKKSHISQKWALISAPWCSSLVGSSPGKHGVLGTCLPGNFSLDHVGNNQEPRIHSPYSLEPAGEYGWLSMFMSRHFTMKEGGRSRKRTRWPCIEDYITTCWWDLESSKNPECKPGLPDHLAK